MDSQTRGQYFSAANEVLDVLMPLSQGFAPARACMEVIHEIWKHYEKVQSNKRAVGILAEEVEKHQKLLQVDYVANFVLSTDPNQQSGGKAKPSQQDELLLQCLSDLMSLLQSADAIMKKYSDHSKLVKVLQANKYDSEFSYLLVSLQNVRMELADIVGLRSAQTAVNIEKLNEAIRQDTQEGLRQLRGLRQGIQEDIKGLGEDLKQAVREVLEEALTKKLAELNVNKPNSSSAPLASIATNPAIQGKPWLLDPNLVIRAVYKNGGREYRLGSGAYGIVYYGFYNEMPVAIKELAYEENYNNAIEELEKEVNIMFPLMHENVISLIGAFIPTKEDVEQHGHLPYLVMEYAERKTLNSYMFGDSRALLTKEQKVGILRGVANGLSYLHSRRTTHRDIKPDNILLSADFTPKITDFGLAKVREASSRNAKDGSRGDVAGSVGYQAPEMLRGEYCTRKVDVWSFGVILFEVMLESRMFGDQPEGNIALDVREDKIPWYKLSQKKDQWHSAFHSLAMQCLRPLPDQRPTMDAISWTLQLISQNLGDKVHIDASGIPVPHLNVDSTSGCGKGSTVSSFNSMPHLSNIQNDPVGSSNWSCSGTSIRQVGSSISQEVQDWYELGADYYQGRNSKNVDHGKAVEFFSKAATAGHAEAMYRLGVCYHKGQGITQDSTQAIRWYESSAKKGNVSAEFNLGICYLAGQGVAQDHARAAIWFEQAAGHGHVKAMTNLGDCFCKGRGKPQDFEKGASWYHSAAEKGWASAQYSLALCYLDGRGMRRDAEAAKKWLKLAADQGDEGAKKDLRNLESSSFSLLSTSTGASASFADARQLPSRTSGSTSSLGLSSSSPSSSMSRDLTPDAAFNEGKCYYFGKSGKSVNYQRAVELYLKAAKAGHAEAQSNLGFCYENGQGVTQNYERAVFWYRQAVEQQHMVGEYNLGICYKNGFGLTQDVAKALFYFDKSARHGYADGQFQTGLAYYQGLGVKQSFEYAVYWFEQAAKQGHKTAQCNLGACYQDGKGVMQNYASAVTWYGKSAQQGSAVAQFNLGNCYLKGRGVKMDVVLAKKWYQLAANQGHKDAQAALSTT